MTRLTCAALAAFFLLLGSGPSQARRHTTEIPFFDRHTSNIGYFTPEVRVKRQASHRKASRHASKPSRRVKGAHREEKRTSGHPAVDSPVKASGTLVETMRRYLGTNPTGWSSLWCGRMLALVAPEAARRISNPNWARAWAELRHIAPRVGAIAVLRRGRNSGHVGVVSGFDKNGNPILISGNHGGRVGEGRYLKGRVIAYVSAT